MLFLVLNLLGRELLLMTVHHNMDESAVLFVLQLCVLVVQKSYKQVLSFLSSGSETLPELIMQGPADLCVA